MQVGQEDAPHRLDLGVVVSLLHVVVDYRPSNAKKLLIYFVVLQADLEYHCYVSEVKRIEVKELK